MIINESYISATNPASRSAANRTVGFMTDLADDYDLSGFREYITATLRDITAAVLECPLTDPAGSPQVTVADKDYDSYSDIGGWLNGNPPGMYTYDPSNDNRNHRMLCVTVPVTMPDTLTGQQAEFHLTPLSSAIIAACSMRDGAREYGDGKVVVFCGYPDGRKSVFRSASNHGTSQFHDPSADSKTAGAAIARLTGTPPGEYLSDYLDIDTAAAMFRHALAYETQYENPPLSAVILTPHDGFPNDAPSHTAGPQTHAITRIGHGTWHMINDTAQKDTVIPASAVRFCYVGRPDSDKDRIYMTYNFSISDDYNELDGFDSIHITIRSSYVEFPSDITAVSQLLPSSADDFDDSPATRLGKLCAVDPHSPRMTKMMTAVFREYRKTHSRK